MAKSLTYEQEIDLRNFFEGGLAQASGLKSPMGPILDQLKYGLPASRGGSVQGPTGNSSSLDVYYSDAESKLISAIPLVSRWRRIKGALTSLPRAHVDVLKAFYTPTPAGLVWGLGQTFELLGEASVAVALSPLDATKGARWRPIKELALANGYNSPAEFVAATRERIRAAKTAYVMALGRGK